MITKQEAQRIKSYVESMLVYETQILNFKNQLESTKDELGTEFLNYVLEIAQRNAEETGRMFLSYLDILTESE